LGVKKSRKTISTLVALFNQGRYAEGEALAKELTVRLPQNGDGWKLLGVMLVLQGKKEEALKAMSKAAKLLPADPDVHSNLGVMLQEQGRLLEAEASERRAIAIKPDHAEAHYNLGITLREQGRLSEAEDSYRRALSIKPDHAEAHYNLGLTLKEQGRLSEAEDSYRRALAVKPDYADAHCNLGNVLQEQGRLSEAEDSYGRALAISPDHADAHRNLGNVFEKQGRLSEAEDSYRRALSVKPGVLANAVRLHLLLPVIPELPDDITAWREHYEAGIEVLMNAGFQDPGKDLTTNSFYLSYHNQNDRPVMERLCHLFRRHVPILTAFSPHLSGWQAPAVSGRRIRVGFLSQFLASHTIGKLYQGFIRHMDRSRFEVVVIHASRAERDSFSESINALADTVVTLPVDLKHQQQAVAAQKLDALFYPDIGMAPSTYFLAYARLAPVQAVGWGHPDTTGLDTIDYFVSATCIEPEDADEYYSETLIRLNRLPCFYQPLIMPTQVPTRAALGLPEAGALYGCPQSLFKFHPDFDAVLSAIAEGDQTGHIVLLEGTEPAWVMQLRRRWAKTSPILLDRVQFLPRMPLERFLALMAHIDVLLDPVHFGSGNTLYEAMVYGTPVVTWPGRFMHGRVVAGAYSQMGVADAPVVGRLDEYAPLAVALGRDPERRHALREASMEAAARELFADMRAVREFEAFIEAAVAAAGRGEKLPEGWRP
jgi:predicted O-linked N-acetylglucosamine transferase (SPINDLY family)